MSSGDACGTPSGAVAAGRRLMATVAACTPLPASVWWRLWTQLRRAAWAMFMVASMGYGLIAPPPVVNSRVPAPASSIAGSTVLVAVTAPYSGPRQAVLDVGYVWVDGFQDSLGALAAPACQRRAAAQRRSVSMRSRSCAPVAWGTGGPPQLRRSSACTTPCGCPVR